MKTARLRTTRAAVTAYFAALGPEQRAVVESTATWYWLADLLREQQIAVTPGHSKYIKAISYAKVKTDAVDAATLAQLLRSDLIPAAHMISPELRAPRDLLRQRLVLVAKRTRCKHAVTGLLAQYNVSTPAELPPLPRSQCEWHAERRVLLTGQLKRSERQLLPTLTPDAHSRRGRAAAAVDPGDRQGGRVHVAPRDRRHRPLSRRPQFLLALPPGPGCEELRREEPA